MSESEKKEITELSEEMLEGVTGGCDVRVMGGFVIIEWDAGESHMDIGGDKFWALQGFIESKGISILAVEDAIIECGGYYTKPGHSQIELFALRSGKLHVWRSNDGNRFIQDSCGNYYQVY